MYHCARGPKEAAKTSLPLVVELGVDSPARLQFGDVAATQLARLSIVYGSPGSVQKLSRLSATAFGPASPNDF